MVCDSDYGDYFKDFNDFVDDTYDYLMEVDYDNNNQTCDHDYYGSGNDNQGYRNENEVNDDEEEDDEFIYETEFEDENNDGEEDCYKGDGEGNEDMIDDYYDDDDEEDDVEVKLWRTTMGRLNLVPKKKLLVISLNGLLIYRVPTHKASKFPKNRHPDGGYNRNIVYKRPYLEEFMKFCLERFEVGLWSSAQKHNIDGVLQCAFKGLKSRLLFVWDKDECSDSGFYSLEKKKKPLYLKDLSKLWSNLSDSSRRARFTKSNTLLIDDQPYKALLNPPNTAIFPATYDANDGTDDALDPKKELCLFLEGLAKAGDVPSYVREHPFGQPAVGPEHPNWNFYYRILRAVKQLKTQLLA